jgi:hypothetical protein
MAQPAHPELQRLLQLLQVERQADLEEYQTKIVNTPLAERRRRGTSWYPVVVTESGFGPGERLYLEVEKTTDLRTAHLFGSGKSVSLFSAAGDPKNPDAIQGVVSFLGLNRMRIVFNVDEIPDWLDDGKLGVNLLFDETTYTEMAKAVREVMGAAGNRVAQLRDVLLGHQPAGFDRKAFTPTLPRLNESQARAVANALQARDVAIIHGPPGTGKTTTLVETILLTLQTEKQVLVCSPSNASVDLLTDLLAARGPTWSGSGTRPGWAKIPCNTPWTYACNMTKPSLRSRSCASRPTSTAGWPTSTNATSAILNANSANRSWPRPASCRRKPTRLKSTSPTKS